MRRTEGIGDASIKKFLNIRVYKEGDSDASLLPSCAFDRGETRITLPVQQFDQSHKLKR